MIGKAKSDQCTGPTLSCSASPTRISPAPKAKPSFIFQIALNIRGGKIGERESAAVDDEVYRRVRGRLGGILSDIGLEFDELALLLSRLYPLRYDGIHELCLVGLELLTIDTDVGPSLFLAGDIRHGDIARKAVSS